MPLEIRISNLNRARKIDRKAVRKAAVRVLRGFKKGDALIDITFVDNRRMKRMNKKYMKRDNPTDVLSFLLCGKPFSPAVRLIGDIYISSDMAHGNARRFGTSFRKELLLYVIHGVLHLVGLSDRTAAERARIRKLRGNARIMEAQGLSRPGDINIYHKAAEELEWVLRDGEDVE